MYVYNWLTLLYTWNYHNFVNQPNSNKTKTKTLLPSCMGLVATVLDSVDFIDHL